ncbi:MAG: UDP-N-acetylglucosamine 2-epimerase (non-hydrolyzing), partial [Bacillota bacterium]
MVLGTRPEVIKLWPVIRLARQRPGRFRVRLVATGQHRELLQAALDWAGLRADWNLDVMVPGQQPAALAARILERLDPVLAREQPDLVMVQGDTSTAWAAALAAFYRRIPVAHVEAGLRSGDRHHPFPEEAHRRMTAVLADYHFAPTAAARQALTAERVDPGRIFVTGNTVVDALHLVRERTGGQLKDPRLSALFQPGRRVILLTTHRRESWGERLRRAYLGIKAALDEVPDAHIVFPWHPNPAVREAAAVLKAHPRVHFLEPPPYPEFIEMLAL